MKEYYYHGTTSNLVDKIKEEGLLCPPTSRHSEVFCDSSRWIAGSHAASASDSLGDKPVLIVIDPGRVPKEYITKWTEEDFFSSEIPPKAIVRIESVDKRKYKGL